MAGKADQACQSAAQDVAQVRGPVQLSGRLSLAALLQGIEIGHGAAAQGPQCAQRALVESIEAATTNLVQDMPRKSAAPNCEH